MSDQVKYSEGKTLQSNRFSKSLWVVLLVFASTCALAQRRYEPPTAVERDVDTFVVKSDGSYVQTTEHVERVETPQGVEDAGAQIFYR